ncbi:MAG: aspartate kinase [Planctomycetota bacterium]
MPFDKVLKFGGAALADGPGVQRCCQLTTRYGGDRPILVVSAHLGVTDLLDTVARSAADGMLEGDRVRIRHRTLLRQLGLHPELLDRYFTELFGLLGGIHERGRLEPSERDLVLSFGERMSARIVAQTLRAMGHLATPVDAFDLGLVSDSNHGAARPLPESRQRVKSALLDVPGIPVVTGFLAKDRRGNLTTLGRNGSDLTAALMAEAVGAGELQLWKAVGGIMTADPKLVPDARVVEHLGYTEAAEFALYGAQVLHGAALAPAQRANVNVRLFDVNDPEGPGTLLTTQTRGEGPVGIAARKKLVRIDLDLSGTDDRSARMAELFDAMHRHNIDPGPTSSTAETLSVFVPPSAAVQALLCDFGARARTDSDLALVALIGRSIGWDTSVWQRAVALLAEEGIEVSEAFVGSRSPSQVFVVSAADVERAVQTLHAGLFRPAAVGA